nr:hypothetical protein [Tanacetum cinerariifolium]
CIDLVAIVTDDGVPARCTTSGLHRIKNILPRVVTHFTPLPSCIL